MIVGQGDIATVLKDRPDFLYFASGVSDSQETRRSEFVRELALLLKQPVNQHLVYFSSLATFNAHTARNDYLIHKREMEHSVKMMFANCTIVRIGNITWGRNPNTLINSFKRRPKSEWEIRDEYRYMVDLDEFLYWIDQIPPWSTEISIPGQRMKVQEVIDKWVI